MYHHQTEGVVDVDKLYQQFKEAGLRDNIDSTITEAQEEALRKGAIMTRLCYTRQDSRCRLCTTEGCKVYTGTAKHPNEVARTVCRNVCAKYELNLRMGDTSKSET